MATGSSTISPNVSIPIGILSQPREMRIEQAVAAIRDSATKPDGDPIYSARQPEKDFGIPRATLGRRLKGMSHTNLTRCFGSSVIRWHQLSASTC